MSRSTEDRERGAADRGQCLAEDLLAAHAEVHDLIGQLSAKVDGIDPDTGDWGDVAALNHYAERLREMLGLVG